MPERQSNTSTVFLDNERIYSPVSTAEQHFKAEQAGSTSRAGRALRNRFSRRCTSLHERSRQKRQVLQDMARPLKQWLIKHRDNPYPSKAEKITLALGSQMTLVQVSNWFANARRRLKNTVRDPDLSWAMRIKLYNSHVVGNAELLSISSDDSMWDSEEDNEDNHEAYQLDDDKCKEHSYSSDMSSESQDEQYPYPTYDNQNTTHIYQHYLHASLSENTHPKYKTSMLHRYLNVSYSESSGKPKGLIKPSGSVSSYDSDLSLSSRNSPSSTSDQERGLSLKFTDENFEKVTARKYKYINSNHDDTYWKEMDAAVALTTLARARYDDH